MRFSHSILSISFIFLSEFAYSDPAKQETPLVQKPFKNTVIERSSKRLTSSDDADGKVVQKIPISKNSALPDNYDSLHKKYLERKERLENEYIASLTNLIKRVKSESYLFVDPAIENAKGYPVFKWLVDEGDIYITYGIDRINPDDIANVQGFEGGAVSFKLGSDLKSEIMKQYSIFQVIKVGEKKFEKPLILAISTNNFSDSNSKHCYSGQKISVDTLHKALCVQYNMTRYSSSHEKAIIDHSRDRTSNGAAVAKDQ
ncbi:MAG: hypothetical protein SVW51_10975 [Pseudomonadota bacterium]|nr:hypothetical protein [Pseudomonadota bacterium]